MGSKRDQIGLSVQVASPRMISASAVTLGVESQFQLERALTSFLRLEARAPVTRACEGRQRGLGP